MDFEFDPDELAQKEDEAARQKRNLALMGGIGDALASQQSFGNMFLGRPNERSTAASRTAGVLSDSIQDPSERQAKLYARYKEAKEAQKMKDAEAQIATAKDPNSPKSKSLKQMAGRWGLQVTPEMSAYDIEQMIDPKKMMESELTAKMKSREPKVADPLVNEIREQRLADMRRKQEQEDQEYQTNFGRTRTKDDAKQIKAASEMKSVFDAKLTELIKIREDKGAEVWDSDAVGRAKQLSKDLLLAYKDLSKLGVLSKADEAILNEIIPADPTEFRWAQLKDQDPILTKLKSFQGDVNRDFENRLSNRLLPSEYARRERNAPQIYRVKTPKGKVVRVPEDKVANALQAGGELLDGNIAGASGGW